MKNNFSTLTKIFTIPFLAFSCNSDQELPAPTVQTNEFENISEIALLEKELGITLSKRDFILTDETGDNQVTLRVAAKEKEELENYLNSVNLSMEPVFAHEYSYIRTGKNNTDSKVEEVDKSSSGFSGIITEFVDEKFGDDVIGVRLNVEIKAQSNNSRINYALYTEHTSGNWPYLAKIKTFTTYEPIGYRLETKSRWYKSWNFASMCKYNGTNGLDPNQCQSFWEQYANNENTFWVDGPYRVKIPVSYWTSGSYSIEFTY